MTAPAMSDVASDITPSAHRTPPRPPRRPYVALIVLGLGLVIAPSVFSMWHRAPMGRDMIDDFRPYMSEDTIDQFRTDLATIGRASDQTSTQVQPRLRGLSPRTSAAASESPSLRDFQQQWPGIDRDMRSMLDTMDANTARFQAVDELPPFQLFPWFFVVPGTLVAATATLGLIRRGHRRPPLAPAIVIAVAGAGLLVAPGVLQMFERAPRGGQMIDSFSPLMTQERVQRIQGYFLVIGAAEGTLRNQAVPALDNAGQGDDLDDVRQLGKEWPRISRTMAPMIGAMSDNLDNYQAVASLPPFPLFPWFFVIPGAVAIALAATANHQAGRPAHDDVVTGPPTPPSADPAEAEPEDPR
jgi:hypothetical protein